MNLHPDTRQIHARLPAQLWEIGNLKIPPQYQKSCPLKKPLKHNPPVYYRSEINKY